MITDSGNRRSFGTAVRDMGDGKGRFDLMPLHVMATTMDDPVIGWIAEGYHYDPIVGDVIVNIACLYDALDVFCTMAYEGNKNTMMLEVAKHMEEGCNKYGERNWESGEGIPLWCFIDSTLRHYVKWKDGQTDESHDRAVVWNLMCGISNYTSKGYRATSEVMVKPLSDATDELHFEADEINLDAIADLMPLGE